MKIFYLTWGETPRLSGVYNSQVINLLTKFNESYEIELIAGLPIINSGIIREKFKYFIILKNIKFIFRSLRKKNFCIIPIFAIQTVIFPKKYTYFLLTFLSKFFLLKKIKNEKPQIIHCRGYHATNLALHLKIKYKLNYKVIFDPRGLFPEEFLLTTKKHENSFTYRKLKEIESFNVQYSDILLSVSETMTKYFKLKGAKKIETIYLSTNFGNSFKEKYFKINDKIKFCYAGALDINTWHKPQLLIDLFVRLNHLYPNSNLTIITNSNHQSIKSLIPDSIKNNINFVSCLNSDDVLKELKQNDIGLLSYMIPETSIEETVANTVFAIKTVEYIASSLPVFVNKYCGGAANFIEQNNLGLLYDPNDLNSLQKDVIDKFLNNFDSTKLFKKSKYFSYENNIKKYKYVYENL